MKPREAPREAHMDDGVSWHVMCRLCPEIEGLAPNVCQPGCYDTPQAAKRGQRRHTKWHDRRKGN